jgi:hypothetical protein
MLCTKFGRWTWPPVCLIQLPATSLPLTRSSPAPTARAGENRHPALLIPLQRACSPDHTSSCATSAPPATRTSSGGACARCPRANARHVRASIVDASIPYPYSGPLEPPDAQNAARPVAGALPAPTFPPPPVLPTRTISACAAALARGPATPATKPAHYLSQTVPYQARKAWG